MDSRRDRKLVRALRAREEDAFSELVRTYQHKVFNIIFRILGDRHEAEDVAQEVFITVFKHIDSFRGDAKFSTWLYRVATNHARNRVKYLSRRARKKHQDIMDTPEGDMADNPLGSQLARPDKQAQAHELEVIIQQGLALLGSEHREIIVLRDIENLTYQEISTITGLAEGTVKSRLFRARVALKTYVKEHYEFEGDR
jgi:RNA polymerase sigma-70 factor (ECF subfamily)